MSLRDSIMGMVITHPKRAKLGIGFAIMFAIGITTGFLSQKASAYIPLSTSVSNARVRNYYCK